EYLNKLPLREAIAELRETVGNEFRRDFHMTAEEIADDIMVQDNQVYVRDHLLTEHALQGIVTRLKSPALSYLLGLRSRIQGDNTPSARAEDAEMLARVLEFECSRNKGVEFKLRMREY